jgi:hypothetical protein
MGFFDGEFKVSNRYKFDFEVPIKLSQELMKKLDALSFVGSFHFGECTPIYRTQY